MARRIHGLPRRSMNTDISLSTNPGNWVTDERGYLARVTALALTACWAYVQRLIAEEGTTAFNAVITVRETVEMALGKASLSTCSSMRNAIHIAGQKGLRAFLEETEHLTTRPRTS